MQVDDVHKRGSNVVRATSSAVDVMWRRERWVRRQFESGVTRYLSEQEHQ